MEQDSVAYGQSLLAGIRERNDKIARDNKKDAKRNAWKKLGMQVAIGVANSALESRQQKFLNDEQLLRSRMTVKTGYDLANKDIKMFQEAENESGGIEGLADKQLRESLTAKWHETYSSGSYSQTTFNDWLTTSVKALKPKRVKALEDRFAATQEYLNSGNTDAYVQKQKDAAPDKTVGGFIGEGVSRLFGKDPDADLHNLINDNMVTESKQFQKDYGSAWKKTRNAVLSKYVATNLPTDPGVPAPVIGDAVDISTTHPVTGEQETVKGYPITTQSRVNGKTVTDITVHVIGPNGSYVPYSAASQNRSIDFNTGASMLTKNQVTLGVQEFHQAPGDSIAALNKVFGERISIETDGKLESNSDDGFADLLVQKQEAFSRGMVMAGITARNEGWASAEMGRKIYLQQAVEQAANKGGVNAFGHNNTFGTLFAIDTLVSSSKLTNGKTSMARLFDDNTKLYNSLVDMDDAQRINLFSTVAGERGVKGKPGYNYFSGSLNEDVVKAKMDALELIFKNPKDFESFSPSDKVKAALTYLSNNSGNSGNNNNNNEDSDTDTTTTTTVSGVKSIAPLSLPPEFAGHANKENKIDTDGTRRAQRKEYRTIIKAYKNLTSDIERFDKFSKDRTSQVTFGMIDALEKRINTRQKTYDDLYNTYTKKYGYTLGEAELADLTDEEKEAYFSTGKRPDRHTPAT